MKVLMAIYHHVYTRFLCYYFTDHVTFMLRLTTYLTHFSSITHSCLSCCVHREGKKTNISFGLANTYCSYGSDNIHC